MTHTLQAIGWTLIHFCWQAAVIAGLYRMASAAFVRRSSQARYLVALSALLLMLVSAAGTLAWEMRGSAPIFTADVSGDVSKGQAAVSAGDFPRSMEPGFKAAESAAVRTLSISGLLPWVDGLWILGVVVLSLRSLGGWWLIQRLRAAATIEAPVAVQASFARIAAAMGLDRPMLGRPVLLRVSSAIAGPVTVGALRSLVLLPLTAATSLSPEELEVVLAHELAHVRRADFLWNLLQTLAETLFFFHPAVWWVSGQIRYERELCCDDIALQFCSSPVVYANALFRLEEQRSRQLRLAMALDGHQSSQTLRMRIARVLDEPVGMTARRPVRPFSLAAACAGLIVLLLPVPQVVASLKPKPSAAVLAAPVQSADSSAAAMTIAPVVARVTAPVVATGVAPESVTVVGPVVASNEGGGAQAAGASSQVVSGSASEDTQAEPQDADAKLATPPQSGQASGHTGGSYIDRMKAAGYDVDLDKFIALKIQGVTPEYAREMSQLGFGKLSADDLIACKIQGVTPEVIAKFKEEGFEVKTVHDAITYRIFNLTPEYAAGMKAAGFDGLDAKQLVAMKVQGVTPEYAKALRQQFPGVTAKNVVEARIFGIDAAFVASAKQHGFSNLSFDKLVQLRNSGLLDDDPK
jgi:beta-lactamase regulating signal transducer with metallopeptidase domain